jgi:hypothetical protein
LLESVPAESENAADRVIPLPPDSGVKEHDVVA